MIDIQEIIDGKLDTIINIIKAEIPQEQQEPDYVILKELIDYFIK